MNLALFLLGAVVLRDDISTIPPHHKWRYDRFEVTDKHLPVDVDCEFHLLEGSRVHLELLTEENLEALRAGLKYEAIQTSTGNTLRQEIGLPGTFAVVVWNDDDVKPAQVALKVALDFSGKSLNLPRTLPLQKQLTVIVLSLAGFLMILTLSARQLMKAMAARATPVPPSPDSEQE